MSTRRPVRRGDAPSRPDRKRTAATGARSSQHPRERAKARDASKGRVSKARDASKGSVSKARDASKGRVRGLLSARLAGLVAKPEAGTHPRIAKRKEEVARASGRRRMFGVSMALCIPALVATAIVLLHTSLFSVDHVSVVGEEHTARSAIVGAAGLTTRPPLIDVNPVVAEQRIEALPWIARATVARHWPHSLTVSVTERVPVAEAAIARSEVELYDASGWALEIRRAASSGLVRVRAVGGPVRPGASVTGGLRAEIELADSLPMSTLGTVRLVEELPGTGLAVRLRGGATAVFGGSDSLESKATALATLLAHHVSLAHVRTIDLRVPSSPVLSSI